MPKFITLTYITNFMKNFLLILFALFAAQIAVAQVKAGKIIIGGQVEFSSTTLESSVNFPGAPSQSVSNTSYTILPIGAYMINDNIALGLGLGYSSSSTPMSVGNTSMDATTKLFTVQPFARYYKAIGGSQNFYFYGQASIGYSTGSQSVTNNPLEQNISQFAIGISPNVAFFPVKRLSIDFGFTGISYSSLKAESTANGFTSSTTTSTLGIGLSSFSPRLGMSLWF